MKKIISVVLMFGMLFSLVACGDNAEAEIVEEQVTTDAESVENIIYVDADAAGANDGSSWSDAYTLLQDALEASTAGEQVWVAEGTYYPTEDDDISVSFQLVDDVDLYGGFTGVETSIEERDWENNETILSGDIGIKDDDSDNSVKVVIAANSRIDGFTISDGAFVQSGMEMMSGDEAMSGDMSQGEMPEGEMPEGEMAQGEESGEDSSSAGHLTPDAVTSGDAASSSNGNGIIIWEVAPTIVNCTITNNSGGKGAGVYIMGTSELESLPTFINTTISNNIASGRGGGVSIDMNSQAIFIDCIFDGNECTDGKGGAIYNDFGGSPLIENCLFINNYAESGAALANDGVSNPVISNTTFYNNTASEAGAALYQGTGPFNDPFVIDSVMWGNSCTQDKVSVYNWNECNPTILYSIVQDGYDGDGVIDVDPLFTDADNMDFTYQTDSLALTAGSEGDAIGYDASLVSERTEEEYETIITYLYNVAVSEEITMMDLTNPVDAADATEIGEIVYVDVEALGTEDGSSWTDAFTSLQDGINYANAAYQNTGEDVAVWVAEGTYVTGDERSDSITLREGVNVYGGFTGMESSLEERDYEENITILSGEIGDESIQTDNSYHVVIGSDEAILDGFTITGGYADGVDGEVYDNKGGGLINYLAGNRVRPDEEPTLGFDTEVYNCIFEDNYAEEGGAVYTYHGGNPTFDNCMFVDNQAQYGAAVLDRAGTNSIYTDCTFSDNYATYKGGAAFTDYGAMSIFMNCTFNNNEAVTAGGAIYAIDRASQAVPNETDFYLIDDSWDLLTDIYSSVYLEDCTLSNNTAGTNGGALYIYDGAYAKLVNCSLDNNVATDAAVTASNSGTVFLGVDTIFENNSPADTFEDGNRSKIVTD